MLVQIGSFCTSNLPSDTAMQQDFVICKVGSKPWWWISWQESTLPNIFHLQWSCLKCILLIKVSQLVIFLMKVFVKLIMNPFSLREIISGLRLSYREFMNWTNGGVGRIVCIKFGAWIQWICKGLPWRIQDHQQIGSNSWHWGTPLNFLQLPFRIWNLRLVLES